MTTFASRACRALAIGFLVAARLAAQQGASEVSPCSRVFAPIPEYPARNSTYGVRQIVSADFDMDGHPDVAQVDDSAGSVLLSAPDGTFKPAIDFFPLYSPDRIAAGDFDGNGKTDLVYTSYQILGILLGSGDGTFAQGETLFLDTTQSPAIATGYFNGDANLDVAVAAGGEARLFVFLGNGDGSFQPHVEFVLGDVTMSIVAADVDGDEKTDLVSGDLFTGNLSILVGNGDGTFQPAVSLPLGLPPDTTTGAVEAADLEGDGDIDLAASTGAGMIVLLNAGGGNFSAPALYPTQGLGGEMALADVDGDGTPDLLTIGIPNGFSSDGQELTILHGNGDGTFEPEQSFAIRSTSASLVVDDFNQDALPDVVTAAEKAIAVLLHAEPGLYPAPLLAYNLNGILPGSDMVMADLNGDGHQDAVIFGSGLLTLLFGDGTGKFAVHQTFTFTYNNGRPAIGQFDPDGHPDIALAMADSTVGVLRNLGDGTFADPVLYPVPSTFGILRTARVDSDAFDDLVVSYGIYPIEYGFHLLLSNGDGTFRDGGTVQTAGYFPVDAVVTDLDADGKTDIASVDGSGGTLSVLIGNGDGTFQSVVAYPMVDAPESLAVGDVSGDPAVDLLVGSVTGQSLTTLIGAGDGSFVPSTLLASPVAPQSVSIADMNLDGKEDIVVTGGYFSNSSRPGIEVYVAAEGGAYESPQVTPLGIRPLWHQLVDVDENGTLDAAYAESSGYGLVIVLSNVLHAVAHNAFAIVSTPAEMRVSAAGLGSLTYQWRKDGVPLADGGPISGSQTATLTVDPAAFSDAGSYDVVVTDSCANVTSNAATLAVEFDDVPLSSPFHADILTIATAGITGGCTDTGYCPANSVSRAEMAVFLLKAKYGSNHVPPDPPPIPTFPDVPANAFAAAWIEELASLEITAGCGNGNYCPDASVTRAEMAVFLLKTLLGSGYVPPDPAGIFADVAPDNFAIAFIEDLYNRGVTAGCNANPLSYCPDTAVPREQMATFLVRTFLGP